MEHVVGTDAGPMAQHGAQAATTVSFLAARLRRSSSLDRWQASLYQVRSSFFVLLPHSLAVGC